VTAPIRATHIGDRASFAVSYAEHLARTFDPLRPRRPIELVEILPAAAHSPQLVNAIHAQERPVRLAPLERDGDCPLLSAKVAKVAVHAWLGNFSNCALWVLIFRREQTARDDGANILPRAGASAGQRHRHCGRDHVSEPNIRGRSSGRA